MCEFQVIKPNELPMCKYTKELCTYCIMGNSKTYNEAIKEFISCATDLCYKEFENDLEVAHTFASILIKAQKEMVDRMTDNEIKKALEEYIKENEFEYFHSNTMCQYRLIKGALTLINRLQTENERLKKENEILSINADTAFQDGLNEAQSLYAEQVKVESIKEFADKVVYDIDTYCEKNIRTKPFVDGVTGMQISHDLIYKRLREMVGEDCE